MISYFSLIIRKAPRGKAVFPHSAVIASPVNQEAIITTFLSTIIPAYRREGKHEEHH